VTIIDDNNKNDIGRARSRARSRGQLVIHNDGSVGRKANEPSGEGAVAVDDGGDDDDDCFGNGGGQYVDLLLFLSKSSSKSIVRVDLVESVDKTSILRLEPQPIKELDERISKRLPATTTSQDIDVLVNLEDTVQCVCRMK